MSTSRSQTFEGRFGRMFRSLHPARFGATDSDAELNLKALGNAMKGGDDPPKDGPDGEESGIPALYTYLGQFIDHDITFDPNSSLQKANDPDGLVDFRTPAFDLDNVYGRGPNDQPYMYTSGGKFLLGSPITGGGDPNAVDLARNDANPQRALIGDPRNDENLIVSQLQGLFLRFHNRLLADNPGMPFIEAQQQMRFHYQYVVLNDFLPRVVTGEVIDALKDGDGLYDEHSLQFYHFRKSPFMPVEFSVAAYRLGHSMVRPGYRLNDANLLPIFALDPNPDLRGFKAMAPDRGIDWARFIDTEIRPYDGSNDPADLNRRLQFAYRLDTSLVEPLSKLPASIASDPPPSLAQRNLIRAYYLQLPSGQAVAKAMHQPVLKDEEILIGQALDSFGPDDTPLKPVTAFGKVFKGNCPLWTYILAEAMHHTIKVDIPVTGQVQVSTPQLGPVGGRILAEVFLGLMFGDPTSMLSVNPLWAPPSGADYTLRDFVRYATGQPAVMTAGA